LSAATSKSPSHREPRLSIECGEEGRVLSLRLDAPPGNVLDPAMILALRRAVGDAARSPSLRAVVFAAAGSNFSYGASIQDHLPEKVAPFLEEFHALFRDLVALSLPCVAAVRGRCLGGGLELAAFCQRVVAAHDAEFGQPEIELGVFAPVASLVLPWRLRGGASDDLLLTGRRVVAKEALALGLVDALADDPEAGALEWIRTHLLAKSATALRFAVQAARAHFHASLLAQLDAVERLYLDQLMRTPDATEGVRAFLEKRKPRFAE
jgi:cyclohexa-1,5-dienecarbonyl-CoA hydratase